MLRRSKRLKSGGLWVSYYYNGRDDQGRRVEIALGADLNEAKRKWAELECKPAPADTGLMKHIFDRYLRDVVPTKAIRTQKDNEEAIKQLRSTFDSAPINAITPQHIAQYRDKRSAKVRANREISLFSHIWNMAREWGYTAKENPCRGVRKNKEAPRDFYADKAVWDAVYSKACQELQDAMDLSYLTGQRPADILKMMETQISDGALEVKPNKTRNSSGKKLRILLDDTDGTRTELGKLIDRIKARPRKIRSLYLIATPAGVKLNRWTLRTRFDEARSCAVTEAEKVGTPNMLVLAARIKDFQFRDIRPKAASETDLDHARKLLGHTEAQITETVYRRVGEVVKPTK
ncbi:MAG: integrase [Sulfuricella sp.]|jgi:integrase